MAQREELGGLVIPGVTAVDPAVRSSSVTSSLVAGQSGIASVNLVGAVGGPSAGLLVAGVLLARDHLASGRPEVRVEDVGIPSQAALEMVRRLRDEDAAKIPAEAQGAGPQEPDADEPGSSPPPGAGR
jgi:hypothetical protein